MIHAGHLGSLPTDEGTASLYASICNALDDARGSLNVELAARKVVQEVQRLCALDEQVIDGHRYEIDAYVSAQGRDDQSLRTWGNFEPETHQRSRGFPLPSQCAALCRHRPFR